MTDGRNFAGCESKKPGVPQGRPGFRISCSRGLEQIPERLVVDLVVELDFGALDDGSQFARAAVGGGLLQVGVAALHVGAQDLADPLRNP